MNKARWLAASFLIAILSGTSAWAQFPGNTQRPITDSAYIECLRNSQQSVAVFLVNGIRLNGVIAGNGDNAIILTANFNQLVYKHAISFIVPSAPGC